jgi:hypothetical protein
MKLHPNSKLTPTSRAAAVRDVLERGWSVASIEDRDRAEQIILRDARDVQHAHIGLRFDTKAALHAYAICRRPKQVRRWRSMRPTKQQCRSE